MGFFEKLQQSKGSGKVLSILNQKGGVGKTTLTFNLAHALAQREKKVLCLDLDPQANLSLLFNCPDSRLHIFNLLVNSVKELKTIHAPVTFTDLLQDDGAISLIPSGQELSAIDITLAGITAPRQLVLRRMINLHELKKHYDYILIDGPPTLGLIMVNIVCASDGIIVPFQADQFSRKGLMHFHETLSDIGDMGLVEMPRIIGYVPNLLETRRKQEGIDYENIQNDIDQQSIIEFKGALLPPIANRVLLQNANAQRKSVFAYAAKEYRELQNQFFHLADVVEESFHE
jgi:chromosome partitioning protein